MQKKTLTVLQYASPIRRHHKQRLILRGLGLSRINQVRQLEDTPSVRGMINKIPHMVKIVKEA